MKLGNLLLTCLRALIRNPMRAALTILGIVVGIAAVVAIREIGEGASQDMQSRIAGMGANTVTVSGASARTNGVNTGMGGRATLLATDADALAKECAEYVVAASPVVSTSGQVIVGNTNWNPGRITGGNEQYLQIENWKIDQGSAFTKQQVDNAERVCLIGQTIAKELYAGVNPIGQEIRIRDVVFIVVGVLESKGSDMFGDKDDCLILPWTSVRTRLAGGAGGGTMSKAGAANSSKPSATATFSTSAVSFYPGCDVQPYSNAPHPLRTRTVDSIAVLIKDSKYVNTAMDLMTPILRRQHRLEPGVVDDFTLRSRNEFANMVTSTSQTMSSLLLAVALISLIVGGVGIMNIMMVSVTERTREIGLRMAVGARPRDIMFQFLLEAILLCVIGGCIGIAIGRGASQVVSSNLGWPVMTSPAAMLVAVTISGGIGMIFGWYPAYKASKLDPIEALHHE